MKLIPLFFSYGDMWKFLLIVILVIYILNKIGLFRVFVQSNHQRYNEPHQRNRPNDGNVHIDNVPNQKKSDFKGGEYVDYEEVK